ncbi:hypothetical protein GN956_G1081 [Arapaima gigas]
MEKTQRNRAPDNKYESPPEKENEYQDLHFSKQVVKPPAVGHWTSQKKFILISFAVNVLLLIIILVLVAVNLSYFKRMVSSTNHVVNPYNEDEGVWHLHDGNFYLFSRGRGTCDDANTFCSQMGAHLPTVHNSNQEWMRSQTGGEPIWVGRDWTSPSGSSSADFPEYCQCELFTSHPTYDCEDHHYWACEMTIFAGSPDFMDNEN